MPIELKMPALSPTMEEGTLAKWLVKEGDEVKSGDILAEIETDKATMEFEAVDEGKIAKILVPEGSEGVKVGAPIAIMAGEGEDASAAASAAPKADTPRRRRQRRPLRPRPTRRPLRLPSPLQHPRLPRHPSIGRTDQGIAAGAPDRRFEKHRSLHRQGQRPRRADHSRRHRRRAGKAPPLPRQPLPPRAPQAAGTHLVMPGPMEQAIPHEEVKLSNIRKTIARRLTEAKQQVPHIYLTVDIQLDALLSSAPSSTRGSRAAASSSASTTC